MTSYSKSLIKSIIPLGIITILGSCATLFPNRKLSDNPESAAIITSDITHFYKAFDLAIKDTTHSTEIFNQHYFSIGSKGLKDFYKIKIQSKEQFSSFVIGHQEFYKSIKPNIIDLKDLKVEIRENYTSFKNLYRNAVFPDLYFVVGSFKSNGTISKNGLLIGTEIISRTDQTKTDNWNKDILRISMERNHIPTTVSHELVHFNQKKMKRGNTLLWKSIREGSAEFITELICGETDADYEDFKGKEMTVWKDFQMDMHKSTWYSWQQPSEKRPRNAGYWMGYMICKSYYEQIGDKEKAVNDILHIQDYDEFLQKSKTEEYIANLAK